MKKLKIKIVFLNIFFLFFFYVLQAQQPTVKLEEIKIESDDKIDLTVVEQEMLNILKKMQFCKTEKCLVQRNEDLQNLFTTSFGKNQKKFWNYPFSELQKKMRILISSDKKVKFYQWNIQYPDHHYQFFTYLILQDKKNDFFLIFLEDLSLDEKIQKRKLTNSILTSDRWYGALYSEIIERNIGAEKYYFLIGWDGLHNVIHRKIIDVLRIDNQQISFGAPVFFMEKNKVHHRIFFDFMPKIHLFLSYQKNAEAIVVDHLDDWLEGLELDGFKIPTGNFNIFYWKNNGFYWLENFSELPKNNTKEIEEKYEEKFLKKIEVFEPKIEKKNKKSPRAI